MFQSDTRVLVVDDSSEMRRSLKMILNKLGMENVEEAENGQIALDLIQARNASGNPFQLVLADWHMPVMEGVDLLKKVRAQPEFKALPFLMITAEAETKNVVIAIQAGASNYMVKPFSPDTVREKIAAVWKKHHGAKAA